MRNFSLCAFSIIFCFNLHAQQKKEKLRLQEFVKLDTIIYLPEKPTVYFPQLWAISYFENEVTIAYPNKETASQKGYLQLYKLNCSDYSLKKIYLDLHDKKLRKLSPMVRSLAENEKYLAIVIGQYLILYNKLTSDSVFSMKRYERFTINYETVKFSGDDIVLSTCYNRGNVELNTNIHIENIETGKTQFTFHPEFLIPEFTLFSPHHYIDVSSNNIFVAQASPYRVDVYNKEGKKIQEIKKDSKDWIPLPSETINRLRKKISVYDPRVMIDSLSIYYDEKSSYIKQIFYRDDSAVLILYKKPGIEKCQYIDFWKQDITGEFKLIDEDVADCSSKNDTGIYTKRNVAVNLSYSYSIINKNKIIIPTLSTGIYPINLTAQELKKKSNEYLINNDYYLSIEIFNWNKE